MQNHILIALMLAILSISYSCSSKKSKSTRNSGAGTGVGEIITNSDDQRSAGEPDKDTSSQDPKTDTATQNEIAAALVDFGFRDFSQIFYNMAAITGVTPDTNLRGRNISIRQFFEEDLLLSLPGIGNEIKSFSAANQTSIVKLGLEFCDIMIRDEALRSSAAPGFPFTQNNPAMAYSPDNRKLLAINLASRFWGVDLERRPADDLIIGEVDALISGVLASPEADQIDTLEIAIGVCTAMITALPTNIL